MSDNLMNRARALGLHGLIAHWDEVADCDWLTTLIAWEEEERRARSLKRRLADARLGEFKPLADFNWDWPRSCDRMAVEDLLSLDFLNEAANVVLVGPNGVGKSTIAANIAHRAVLEGHTVRFATAASMLGELAALDSDTLLQRKLRFYARQHLLVIDEVGYLSYSNPPRRPAVQHRLKPDPAELHHNHHQPSLLRVGRGLPQRHLRRRPGRPPRPQRRDHRHRRRFLPPQGGRRAPEAAQRRAPPPA